MPIGVRKNPIDFQGNRAIFGLLVAKKLSKIGQKWGFRSIKSKSLNQSSCNLRLLFLGVRTRPDLIFKTIRQFLAWIYLLWPHIKPQLALAWTSYQTSSQTGQDRLKIWSSSSFFFATSGMMHPRTLLAHKCRHCRCPIVFFVSSEYVACHHSFVRSKIFS